MNNCKIKRFLRKNGYTFKPDLSPIDRPEGNPEVTVILFGYLERSPIRQDNRYMTSGYRWGTAGRIFGPDADDIVAYKVHS